MLTIFATLWKEWTLLVRDKIGLLILIILPMLLVLLICLSHGNKEDHSLSMLVADNDKTPLSALINSNLNKTHFLNTMTLKEKGLSLIAAQNAVQAGDYQALLIIPKGFSEALNINLRHSKTKAKQLQLLTDPGMNMQVRASLTMPIQLLLKNVELKLLKQFSGQPAAASNLTLLQEKPLMLTKNRIKPNTVQQNVPAWALFGMFFILIPMAGNMVREREFGVYQRLSIAPAFQLDILLGKIIAFIVFNQIQLWFMLSIGLFILPMFDMTKLDLANHIPLIILTGIAASAAATSFGVLTGTYAKSYEQATVLGPFIVVIASAVGGIFVPNYLMPASLKVISELSPLQWGQSAFLNIFVRNESLQMIWPDLAKLFGFAAGCLLISLLKSKISSVRKSKFVVAKLSEF